MKQVLIILLIAICTINSREQEIFVGDSLGVTVLPIEREILDSSQLKVTIVFRNVSPRPIAVYTELYIAYPQERFGNASAVLEKQTRGKFTQIRTDGHKTSDEALTNRAYRHYDPPTKYINPKEKDTVTANLLEVRRFFDSGSYRIKLSIRTRTIPNMSHYEPDSTTTYIPPEDKLLYMSTRWIYFRIPKPISYF